MFRTSLVSRMTPRGDVVSCLKLDPSVRMTIWSCRCGRFGRGIRFAFRVCVMVHGRRAKSGVAVALGVRSSGLRAGVAIVRMGCWVVV